ncbi:unnamed protein product, partial [Leptidea sinapis]
MWVFNQFVNKIPYSKLNQNFDGICSGVILKSTTSWSSTKSVFVVEMQIYPQRTCEQLLLRSCEQYYSSESIPTLSSTETEGAGLVCFQTGDPAEHETDGVLVGVTSLMNKNLPNLHTRIGLFHDWVTNAATGHNCNALCIVLIIDCAICMFVNRLFM